jgi:ABC-type Fe3+-hydroxamate transport system substrate-binding protein
VRAVSLVPSITETLLAWGVTPVACTRFCEQPTLRHVGGTKDPDLDAIEDLRPDVVLLNDEENRKEDHDALLERGLAVHVVRVNAVDDVPGAMAALAERLELDVAPIELPAPVPSRLRVFVPIWKRPWMSIGADTYGTSILGWCGATNVFGDDERYPETTLDAATARRPELVVAPSEPYPFAERHRSALEVVAPTIFVDGRDLFWWGARTPHAVRRLQAVVADVGLTMTRGERGEAAPEQQ